MDRDRKKFRSELEKEVFNDLSQAGYRMTQQYMVGECVIDLVVEGENGNRIAIQCDGDRSQMMESVEQEMARQLMLRRLGWDFVRVRGSEFFQHRDKVMKKLQRRLRELAIAPIGPEAEPVAAHQESEPLHETVIRRAELIRNRWKDIPTTSSIRKKTDA